MTLAHLISNQKACRKWLKDAKPPAALATRALRLEAKRPGGPRHDVAEQLRGYLVRGYREKLKMISEPKRK